MAGKKKKKLFKECALEMIHILKTGKFEKNHSRSVGSLYPTKLIRKKIYLNLVYYRPTH